MTEFSDYLAAARASRSGGGKAMSPVSAGTAKAKSGGQDPLSWLVDILSRPMRAVENIPNSIFDEMLKSEQASKTGQSYNVLGGIGNVLGSPVRGLFSTNAADQPTGAQLIEKGTDAMGGLNPNYVDTQDNVNPILKGVAGFGLDVGLDPLTYIPGAQLAEAGKWVARGAKGAAEAADALVAGSNIGKAIGATGRVAARAAAEAANTAEAGRAANAALIAEQALQKDALAGTAFGAAKASEKLPAFDFAGKAAQPIKTSDILAQIKAIPQTAKTAEEAKFVQNYMATQRKAEKAAAKGETPTVEDAAAALLQKSGPEKGSSIAEQFAAKGVVPQIQEQLAKLGPGVATPAPVVVNTAADTSNLISKQIADLEAQLGAVQAKGAAAVDSPTIAKRLDSQVAEIQTQLKDLRKQQKTATTTVVASEVSGAKAAKNFSSSAALRDILADPTAAAQMKSALGENVVAKLAGIKTPQALTKATDHLSRVLQGEVATNSPLQKELTQELLKTHDIKVPGTNVIADQGTSAVGTKLMAEVDVEAQLGKTYPDSPSIWVGNYDPRIIDEVARDLPPYIKEYFVNLEGKPFMTGKGALSSSDVMGEGIHKFPYEFNQMDQWSATKAVMKRDYEELARINKEMKKMDPAAQIAAKVRANQLKDTMIQKAEIVGRVFDRKGVAAYMGIKDTRIRLYHHQMLRALRDASTGNGFDLAYFNYGTRIPETNIMDAVVALNKNPNLSDEALRKLLSKEVGSFNFLNETKDGIWQHYPGKTPPKGIKSLPNKNDKGIVVGHYGLISPNEVASSVMATLRKAQETIATVVAHNDELALARIDGEVKDISIDIFNKLAQDAEDPAAFGDFIRETANPGVFAGERQAKNYTMAVEHGPVSRATTDFFPSDMLHDSQHIEAIQKASNNWMKADLKESFQRLGFDEATYLKKQASENVLLRKDILDGVGPDGKIVDQALYEEAVMRDTLGKALENSQTAVGKRLFRYDEGMAKVIHDYDRSEVTLHKANASYYLELERVMKAHSTLVGDTKTPMLTKAFQDIANGVESDLTKAARADLQPLLWEVFGNPSQANAMGIWQRSHASLEDIQVYMAKAKMDFPIDISLAREVAKDGDLVKAGLDQWKTWAPTIEDPMKFLADMHWAGTMLRTNDAAANLFRKIPGATSPYAKTGFTKVGKLDPFTHPLLSRMPEGTHVSDEIIGQVQNLEKKIMEDLSPNSEFGKWINDKYIPLLSIWKKGVTIYRPGHHIRNLLSSEGIQYTVEGTRYYARSGSAAMRVLMAHKAYQGVDWAKTVMDSGFTHMPKGNDFLFKFGNKDITIAELYKAAEEHGLFTDFKHIEDLFDPAATNSIQKFIDPFKGTKIEKIAGGLSEYQAHFSRLHHFTQVLMKQGTKGKNWDSAIRDAAIKIKRHHPDGLTLTNFEKKYMKPLIPFYSWFRQILPIIAEGVATHPGRFMQYPKASYNLAVAMGVNPQSIQDPFPRDQLFPSFITDQLTGPVANIGGNYYSAQPGYAYADVLNQFVADPKRGLVSMITPFIKTPGELITGTKWDTGVKINDFSDYIDSQIPGINYLANFSGTSVTGSAVSLVSGQGIDPQYAVSKGNKTPLDQAISVSNWFTGAGVQNLSKQNLINYAEIEKRNAASQQQKQDQGKARSGF